MLAVLLEALDIMIVLDDGIDVSVLQRLGDPDCTDLENAREGIKTFLSYMDPAIDKVGLAVFPPSLNQSYVTSCPNLPGAGTRRAPSPTAGTTATTPTTRTGSRTARLGAAYYTIAR